MSQLWMSVLELTAFYALLGLAYLLVYEGSGLFNLAIGQYAMAAALSAAWLILNHDVSPIVGLVVGMVGAGVLSGLTELLVVRPVRRRTGGDELPALIALVATLAGIEQLAGWLFGQRALPGRPLIRFDSIQVFGATVAPYAVILICAAVLIYLAVALWRRSSSTGRLLRAVGDNEHAAKLLGLPVSRIRLTAFVLAGAIAGIAGVLFAPKVGVTFHSGLGWTLTGFLVLVIGGTGSITAPIVGAFLLACVEVWAPYFFGSAWTSYLIFAIALVFFALRPVGIFARRVRA